MKWRRLGLNDVHAKLAGCRPNIKSFTQFRERFVFELNLYISSLQDSYLILSFFTPRRRPRWGFAIGLVYFGLSARNSFLLKTTYNKEIHFCVNGLLPFYFRIILWFILKQNYMDTIIETLIHLPEFLEVIKPIIENHRLLLDLISRFDINSIIKLLS
jgi:hypothetical protein